MDGWGMESGMIRGTGGFVIRTEGICFFLHGGGDLGVRNLEMEDLGGFAPEQHSVHESLCSLKARISM